MRFTGGSGAQQIDWRVMVQRAPVRRSTRAVAKPAHFAGVRGEQSGSAQHQCRLAGAAWADHGERFAHTQHDIDIAQYVGNSETTAHPNSVAFAKAANLERNGHATLI